MSVTKSTIVRAVSKRLFINESDVQDVVDCFIDELIRAVNENGEAKVADLGTFGKRLRERYQYRDIRTGETKFSPMTYKVGFRPSKNFEKAMLPKEDKEESGGNLFDGNAK